MGQGLHYSSNELHHSHIFRPGPLLVRPAGRRSSLAYQTGRQFFKKMTFPSFEFQKKPDLPGALPPFQIDGNAGNIKRNAGMPMLLAIVQDCNTPHFDGQKVRWQSDQHRFGNMAADVPRMNFNAKNPPYRQAENRWQQGHNPTWRITN